MIIGVPKETIAGERRVALVPDLVPRLIKAGLEVCVEAGAGAEAGFGDQDYLDAGARLEPADSQIFGQADILLKVRPPTIDEIPKLKEGCAIIGFLEPFASGPRMELLAARKATAFAMELMPRIARAQLMDALSAMSTVAGYKAVLLAANRLPRFFPLLMTAAGTITPARVFVIGAGVAGLEAIGTAKRLGAIVEAYDTRPAVREEVVSVGAKFVELALETKDAGDKGGYAKAQTEEFYRKQQEMMTKHVAASDVVIAAALVMGKHAPLLITEEMVRGMRPGSVIVDLATEQGGNCALTEPGRDVMKHGVVIMGPSNLPSTIPVHSSQMYARTVANFLMYLLQEGRIHLDFSDEIIRSTLVTHQGEVVNEAVKSARSPRSRAG
jgi:NAD(P) transhydrogenase subunit alpha